MSRGLVWLPAHRVSHELSPGQRASLSQLPLTLTMVLVLAIVLVFHPELLLDPVFVYGLVLHAVLFILALAVPWHRPPGATSLSIPILDFLPIGMLLGPGGRKHWKALPGTSG